MPDTIHISKVDETPAIASASLLPILKMFLDKADIKIEEHDISLSSRILAANGIGKSGLSALGGIVKEKTALVIKMPNISATLPQLRAAIKELQDHGNDIPDYPEDPQTPDEQEIKTRYDAVLGSVANPVLRQGNSIRFVPEAVKNEAKRNPHAMGTWKKDSRTHVAHMSTGDFAETEKSSTIGEANNTRIEFVSKNGEVTILKDDIEVEAGTVLDTATMDRKALRDFLDSKIDEAKEKDLLASFHFKATMMVKTDGVFFGDSVRVYFKELFAKHKEIFDDLNINPSSGMNSLRLKISKLPKAQKEEIEADIKRIIADRADVALIDPKSGKSNLDDPSMIIDISMANLIRWSTMMSTSGEKDTMAIIPDRTFSTTYQIVIDDMKQNGALDPATIGTVINIGLMAQKAEEYGSKPTTIEAPSDGEVRIVGSQNNVISSYNVSKEDIFRVCRTTRAAIDNWIETTILKATDTGFKTILWLDENRPHDKEILTRIKKSAPNLPENISVMAPEQAMQETLNEIRAGRNIIAATGNVWRDYITDLFPILEVGSNAKMTSLVPMLNGGLMAETGAGGTAVDLYNTFLETNRLNWDSLGDFTAISEILKELGRRDNKKAKTMAASLDLALDKLIKNGEVPSQSHIDTREHHLRLAQHWASYMATQNEDLELNKQFSELSNYLEGSVDQIVSAINSVQDSPVKMGGYYDLGSDKLIKALSGSFETKDAELYNKLLRN